MASLFPSRARRAAKNTRAPRWKLRDRCLEISQVPSLDLPAGTVIWRLPQSLKERFENMRLGGLKRCGAARNNGLCRGSMPRSNRQRRQRKRKRETETPKMLALPSEPVFSCWSSLPIFSSVVKPIFPSVRSRDTDAGAGETGTWTQVTSNAAANRAFSLAACPTTLPALVIGSVCAGL